MVLSLGNLHVIISKSSLPGLLTPPVQSPLSLEAAAIDDGGGKISNTSSRQNGRRELKAIPGCGGKGEDVEVEKLNRFLFLEYHV